MFHSLRLAAAATVLVAAPVLAFAQPNVAGAPTPTRPITQPTFTTPALLAARSTLLPSGAYRLSIDLPANGRAAAHSATDTVTLTHTGASLTVAVTSGPVAGGQSFNGTIDAAGAVAITLAEGGAALHLSGTAMGAGASGDAFVTGAGVSDSPHGTFDLTPPGQPQARARANQLIEAINGLLHAIGCWAHGGAGC